MDTDFLIIGQGITGTLLSYQLLQLGNRVMVLDEGMPHTASRVAAAVINPRSGRQWKPAPDAPIFIPAALEMYRSLEQLLQLPLLRQTPICIMDAALPGMDTEGLQQTEFFSVPQSGLIDDSWLVDAAALLQGWRRYLEGKGMFRKERYIATALDMSGGAVQYDTIKARAIVFCEGAAARYNPLWRDLPFTKNRGEALLLSIAGLPADVIYHHELRLVPREKELFWYGSNYRWQFDDLLPDEQWRTDALKALEQWLNLPFRVEDHIVAERPTTAGQVPLLGRHPHFPAAAIFNGLGTRGFSSGPYWARELAQHLATPPYDIKHYRSDWFEKQFS